MSDTGDIWQRYDAKVVQVRQLEAQLADLEKELAEARGERAHWSRVARHLSERLQVARNLAERLRAAQAIHAAPASPADASEAAGKSSGVREEFDRAREVLGLVLTALTKALDDDDEAVAELGRRLRHHAGGKLLYSITRGSLTLVPVDGRYLVDRTWLRRLDLDSLRGELDIAAQSGMYPVPEGASIVHTQPLPTQFAVRTAFPVHKVSEVEEVDELLIELEAEEVDSQELPPPPSSAAEFAAPPPLIPALPDDEPFQAQPMLRPLVDTVRTSKESTLPMLIPNLRIGRLIKTPSGG